MTWTTPMTFVAGTTLTAAQLNVHLRDNLNETAPAKATTAGRLMVSTAANAIAERAITDATVTTSQTTVSTTYANLATVGPSVTVTTGTRALVFVSCAMFNSAAGNQGFMSIDVSSATTIAASDTYAVVYESSAASDAFGAAIAHLFTTLTAGSNVFTAKYRVTAGTGTFFNRNMCVIAL